ncbi:hypothetical protein FRB99_004449 [Tulasnella sp. 403]|nr:hypothetical protein FRB99_004449 [Tulasnella sp. 403]
MSAPHQPSVQSPSETTDSTGPSCASTSRLRRPTTQHGRSLSDPNFRVAACYAEVKAAIETVREAEDVPSSPAIMDGGDFLQPPMTVPIVQAPFCSKSSSKTEEEHTEEESSATGANDSSSPSATGEEPLTEITESVNPPQASMYPYGGFVFLPPFFDVPGGAYSQPKSYIDTLAGPVPIYPAEMLRQ